MVVTKNSQDMQNMINEIDRLDTDIFYAKTHLNKNPHSGIGKNIQELEEQRTRLMDNLDNHLSTWIEKLPEVKHGDPETVHNAI